jgi:hypothetical protein
MVLNSRRVDTNRLCFIDLKVQVHRTTNMYHSKYKSYNTYGGISGPLPLFSVTPTGSRDLTRSFVSSNFGSPVKTDFTTSLYKSIFDMLNGFYLIWPFILQKITTVPYKS